MPDVFARLEEWSHGHKARSVAIESPDSYGAGCWTVTLGHEHGVTGAAECAFFTFPDDKGGAAEYRRQAEAAGFVYVAGEDMDDWPGFAATVACALDAFDRGVWGPRKGAAPEGVPALAAAEERGRVAERGDVLTYLRDVRGRRSMVASVTGLAEEIERGAHVREAVHSDGREP